MCERRGDYRSPKSGQDAPRRATIVLTTLCALAAAAPFASAQPRRPTFGPFPIAFTVATDGGAPAADDRWLDAQLELANRVFAPSGVSFRRASVHPMDDAHARLENRGDRNVLGALVRPRVVNAFVVAQLRDVDEPERLRMGVHWRSRTHTGKHYVIVARTAGSYTLAHELGHFFGNHQHSPTPGNIMSYERGDGEPFFDAAQIAVIRRHARRYLRTGELTALPDGS